MAGILCIYLMVRDRHRFVENFQKIGLSGIVGGVIWVYLPLFGINEVPSMLTVVGGCIVSGAILLNSLGSRQEPVPAKPL